MTFDISDTSDTAASSTRDIIQIILNRLIGSLLEPSRVQAHKMAHGQFLGSMTDCAEDVFIHHVLFVLAGIETVVLVISTLMAFKTIRIHIDGAIDPAPGGLAAMAAHPAAGFAAGVIAEPAGFSTVGIGYGYIGRHIIVKMGFSVCTGALVAGTALPGNPIETVVKRMRPRSIGPLISSRKHGVGWIVVAGDAVLIHQGISGQMTASAGRSNTSFRRP